MKNLTAVNAAREGVDFEASLQVVKCTTRFATTMCVVIAVIKVGLYFKTGAEVVRTSALDSLGDLMANCMTLYIGYRMSRTDPVRYPVGQSKFQSIGCLVFSTFMFALMVGNALGNIESLIESEDDVGQAAISRMFWQTGSPNNLGGEFEKWRKHVEWKDDAFEWDEEKLVDADGKLVYNPAKKFFELEGDESEKEMAKELPEHVTYGEVVAQASEYQNDAEEKSSLIFQNGFLAVCATYKLCLWLYCILYAIPKSKSSVLVALATDKRNDFICTYSVIIATSLAFMTKNAEGKSFGFVPEERVDPLVSLLMSFFIIYSWSALMIEHMTILSQECSPPEFCEVVRNEVGKIVQSSPCSALYQNVKSYQSSEKHIIEVALSVDDQSQPYGSIAKVINKVQGSLETLEDVERVVVTTAV